MKSLRDYWAELTAAATGLRDTALSSREQRKQLRTLGATAAEVDSVIRMAVTVAASMPYRSDSAALVIGTLMECLHHTSECAGFSTEDCLREYAAFVRRAKAADAADAEIAPTQPRLPGIQ